MPNRSQHILLFILLATMLFKCSCKEDKVEPVIENYAEFRFYTGWRVGSSPGVRPPDFLSYKGPEDLIIYTDTFYSGKAEKLYLDGVGVGFKVSHPLDGMTYTWTIGDDDRVYTGDDFVLGFSNSINNKIFFQTITVKLLACKTSGICDTFIRKLHLWPLDSLRTLGSWKGEITSNGKFIDSTIINIRFRDDIRDECINPIHDFIIEGFPTNCKAHKMTTMTHPGIDYFMEFYAIEHCPLILDDDLCVVSRRDINYSKIENGKLKLFYSIYGSGRTDYKDAVYYEFTGLKLK